MRNYNQQYKMPCQKRYLNISNGLTKLWQWMTVQLPYVALAEMIARRRSVVHVETTAPHPFVAHAATIVQHQIVMLTKLLLQLLTKL